jgi:hypothetical protein
MKTTASERYTAAVAAVKAAEDKGMSASTINKRYREMFAAIDGLKAAGLWS